MILEDTLTPIADLDRAEDFTIQPDTSLLAQTVVLKLNGGLGTGMGLDKAKSLLKVKGDDTFLDLTAKQVIQMRKDYGFKVKFMLMNSFSTSEDTMHFFETKYPSLAGEDGLEMLQNKVPKLDETTFEVSNVYVCGSCKCYKVVLRSPAYLLSLPRVHRIQATSGAHLDTEICMRRLLARGILIPF
jgi:hypothetical protein